MQWLMLKLDMAKFPSSIRQKVILGYVLSLTVIIAGTVFTYVNLGVIEEKVVFSNVISDFFDTILEMRRFEKNYFLYRKEDDYRENLRFVNRAKELVAGNKEGLKEFVSIVSVPEIEKALDEYKKFMVKDFSIHREVKSRSAIILEIQIRTKGKQIVTIAEDISKIEQKNIRILLLSLHRILITATIFLIIIGVVFGYVLLRTVTKPLKLLEVAMKKISGGRMERVSIDSPDREIVSLSRAFNRMLRELEWRQRHLVQSEKLASLGTLLSGMAHELNNPLSNISTSWQILDEEIEGATIKYKKELLSQIGEQTNRARDIVRSILEFSRAKELKKEMLSLKKLVNETIIFVRGEVPTEVEITVDVPEEVKIYADKQRIQQVFLNLIKNAIGAIPFEGIVTISARSIIGEEAIDFDKSVALNNQQALPEDAIKGSTVYIKIQDTGMGIGTEVLPKIFDPFFTTKDVGKGSGLGLFITHAIIEEHGGSIKVKSQPGHGAIFLIRLPQQKTN